MCVSGVAEAAESERDVGWGRVCVFLKRLGKKADSRSLSLAHCDLTATDLLELGGYIYTLICRRLLSFWCLHDRQNNLKVLLYVHLNAPKCETCRCDKGPRDKSKRLQGDAEQTC